MIELFKYYIQKNLKNISILLQLYISHISLFIIAYILIYIYTYQNTQKNTQTAFVIHNAINLKIKQCIIQII